MSVFRDVSTYINPYYQFISINPFRGQLVFSRKKNFVHPLVRMFLIDPLDIRKFLLTPLDIRGYFYTDTTAPLDIRNPQQGYGIFLEKPIVYLIKARPLQNTSEIISLLERYSAVQFLDIFMNHVILSFQEQRLKQLIKQTSPTVWTV